MAVRMRVALGMLVVAAVSAHLACDGSQVPRIQHHVLNRIGYGPDAWSRARIQQIGVYAYIEEQLQPQLLDDSALEAQIASLYPVTTMSYGQSRNTYHEYTGNAETGPYAVKRDGTRAKLLRALKSKRQLEQVLVDFWFNHFNVDSQVEEARWGFLTLERDAIRAHVFGNFEDMLRATARNPGMLDYLDNALNFKDGFVYLNRRRGINENYAREILELHTMGVDGGYTQQDVREVARAFTGWSLTTAGGVGGSGFYFNSAGHDRDAKSVLGLQLPADRGEADANDVMHLIANLPQTAERISRKLCQRFISETPPENVVQAGAETFLNTQGDLREVYRTILHSPEFSSLAYERTKVKRPLVYAVTLARAIGVSDDAAFVDALDGRLVLMGEGLFRAGPPTGYPESSRYWSGEGTYLIRLNLAWNATHAMNGFAPQFAVTGTTPAEIVDQLALQYLRGRIEPTTRQALIDMITPLPAAARVQEAAATLFASPDFLVH
jgi:uncharacterized protein (DUF1800 family)